MTTPPRVSVLLPCRDHGAFIDDAIASVLAQTLPDVEIVVVDDGSTDPATVEKLRSLRVDRATVLRTSHRGLPAARNHAAAHASGEYLCALDADDRLAPTWLATAVARLEAEPALAFVSHWLETFGDEHWTWTPERCDLPSLLARNAVNGAAVVRRTAFETVGGYDEEMRDGCEDWDFWLRLVERGLTGAIVPEVFFYYRRRADSMSRAMLDPAACARPLRQLIARHEEPYRRHLADVVVARHAESLRLAGEIAGMERDRLIVLEPALGRAREEAAAVSAKVARAEQQVRLMREREVQAWQVAELSREVADLKGSWSWRLTAPLRAVYARLTGHPRR